MRTTAAAVLMLITAVGSAYGQCVSEVRQIASGATPTSLVAGPVAWSGRILAVAFRQVRDDTVYVTLYDEFGNALFEPRRFSGTSESEIQDILWDGENFAVFYKNAAGRLVLRRVSTTSELVGSPIELIKIEIGPTDELDFAWSETLGTYVIARTDNLGPSLWLSYVSRQGTLTRNVQVATPAADSLVRLAVTESGVVGAFFEQDPSLTIGLVRVQGEVTSIRTVWTPGEDLVVAAADEDFVLARTVLQTDGRRSVRWKTIDFRGAETREERRLLVGTGLDVSVLSLQNINSELALTYLDARRGFGVDEPELRLRRFTPLGITISDTHFAAADDRRSRQTATTEHGFVWTGASYITVVLRETSDGEVSYFVRLCPLAAEISAPRLVARGSTITLTGTGDGGVPPYSYVWNWGENSSATGQTLQQTFHTLGDFRYTLTVTDETDTETETTFDVTVYEPEKPGKPRRRSVRK